jgi:hypothetical protein
MAGMLTRRRLIKTLACALPLGAMPRAARASSQAADSHDPFAAERLMADVRAYFGFGVHRTAYPGDQRTSLWLADRFRALGLETSQHTWPLRQFFLEEASIEDAQGRVPAFPLWLPRATAAQGLRARLAVVDAASSAPGLAGTIAWLQPATPEAAARDALEQRAREAGAVALLFTTNDRAGTGHFVAENAERKYVDTERPVPTLTFGAGDTERLRASVGRDVTVRITGRIDPSAKAANVLGRLTRSDAADWIVVSTPSSGWFTCGGERGPGVAMLLALADWASAQARPLNYLFVANSGHELDYLGARLLHEARIAPSPDKTRAWLHLGASIATPPWREIDGTLRPTDRVTMGSLQASVELAPLMRAAFADLPMYRLSTDTRIGEFRDLADAGYQGLGVVGGSDPWFHVERDDPSAVSGETLSAVTRAAARTLEAVENLARRAD